MAELGSGVRVPRLGTPTDCLNRIKLQQRLLKVGKGRNRGKKKEQVKTGKRGGFASGGEIFKRPDQRSGPTTS